MSVKPAENVKKQVLVVGAGIIGLSIATELVERGYQVIIAAREFPEDCHSSQFSSPWAGANWASHAQTHAGQRREAYTLARLRDLADSEPSLVRHTPFYYVWNVAPGPPVPWFASLTPDMRSMRREEIPEGWKYGRTFTSITLDAPRYLLQMARCLRAQGVEFQRRVFHSLDEARRSTSAHMIINATGLGARSLIGVEDPQVHPVRGQTVLVKAPLVQACYTDFDPHPRASEGHKTYIIPRPGPQGHVILGGTHQPGVFSWLPDSETACRILKEAYKLCPALSNGTGWENIEVISHNVGLRPSRTGEMRLQLEQRAMPASKQSSCQDRVYACVHAYGIGAAGYESSLGIAVEACDLVDIYFTGGGSCKSKL